MEWITRERPKIDRIACPWLICGLSTRKHSFIMFRPTRCLAWLNKPGPFRTISLALS